MGVCEMCGRENSLVKALVEGVELTVCVACAKFGTVRSRVQERAYHSKPVVDKGPEFKVASDFAARLRKVREGLGLKQEDFAKYLNERVSVVAKWENGDLEPSVEMAKKVGKVLGMNFIEQMEEVPVHVEKRSNSDELTLGDFVKIRKRK